MAHVHVAFTNTSTVFKGDSLHQREASPLTLYTAYNLMTRYRIQDHVLLFLQPPYTCTYK